MAELVDFLSFRRFITPSVLIFFYYLGALVMPMLGWWLGKTLYRRLVREGEEAKEILASATATSRFRPQMVALFLFCFLCMELGWRMLFEFLIAYFQIHDALVGGA